jgi:hypothetical protein
MQLRKTTFGACERSILRRISTGQRIPEMITLPYGRQTITEADIEAVAAVLRSN